MPSALPATATDMQPAPGAVLITGAGGFIGRHLQRSLQADGYRIWALRHGPATGSTSTPAGVTDISRLDELPAGLRFDAIVNLAGARILGVPWTSQRRRLLLESRLATTRALVDYIRRQSGPPPVLVSASAVGYYGIRGNEPLDESAAPQDIFQSRLCADWERAAVAAENAGARVVRLRLGIVLGTDGGALPQLLLPARLGLGAKLGNGRQGMPWIHIEDAVRMIRFALRNGALAGAVNAVAPEHVTQAQFQRTLGRVLHRPVWLRVPAWPLRRALGEMAQLLLDGQHVVPVRAVAAGFEFRHPRLEGALSDLLQVK